MAHDPLTVRVLGELAVVRGKRRLPLPQSKKTRALLAYLVVSGRPHRRERLCSLLWDVTDDPRGALRWSLSKLRRVVDQPGVRRLCTDRDLVVFDHTAVAVDVLAVARELADGCEGVPTDRLVQLEAEFRGEFLEGLELPDFFEFQSWCVAEREQARLLHARLLETLVDRLREQPEEALRRARQLVDIDPLNEAARVRLVRLLANAGRIAEARQQGEAGLRLFRELGSARSAEVQRAYQEVLAGAGVPPLPESGRTNTTAAAAPVREVLAATLGANTCGGGARTLIGRTEELRTLHETLDAVMRTRRARAVLLTGEPGVGKTRVLRAVAEQVRQRGGTVLEGPAYELERNRPYGPWIDALRCLPAVSVGDTIGADLAPLLPEFGPGPPAGHSRERLFGAVVEVVAARVHTAPPVLIVLDDVQWLDDASLELLHYVMRMNRHRPLLVALAARSGEVSDNAPLDRALRALGRLEVLDAISVLPLSKDDTAALVREENPDLDPDEVFAQCGGNPLFALELARSRRYSRSGPSPTLVEIVRDRVARLSSEEADVLRWGAVLGPAFRVPVVCTLTRLVSEHVLDVLERIQRHGLVREASAGGDAYRFAHDVVRNVVYADISAPRRRLMHHRVATTLRAEPGERAATATDVAHHAALAGNAALAADACVAAGRHCLRLFAVREAETLARQGLHFAEQLPEPDRVPLTLELLHISTTARKPPDIDAIAAQVQHLAERALDLGRLEHARFGFNLLSHLRWEGGNCAEAREQMMRAELVSRASDAPERITAMGDAARCLAMLERDLGKAEALAREAQARGERIGIEPVAVPLALGLLCVHAGQLDEAAALLARTRALAAREQDHVVEFQALERVVMLELQRGQLAEARRLSVELVRLGTKVREGSEAPFARALEALCRYAAGDTAATEALGASLDALRSADAKYRLGYVLTRAAGIDVERGDTRTARARATEALAAARALDLTSEIVLAEIALLRAATARDDGRALASYRRDVERRACSQLSAEARAAVCQMSAPAARRAPMRPGTARRRRYGVGDR